MTRTPRDMQEKIWGAWPASSGGCALPGLAVASLVLLSACQSLPSEADVSPAQQKGDLARSTDRVAEPDRSPVPETRVAETAPALPARRVVVLSLDGCRWDYLADERLVNLHAMIDQGARAGQVIVTTPSMSGPGHVTLLTGAWAGTHGIVFNKFYDREDGFVKFMGGIPVEEQTKWLLAEPVWAAAKRAGLTTAAVHWPATAGEYAGRKVDHVVPYDASWSNAQRVAAGIDLLRNEKPHLLFIYTNGVSPASYAHGAASKQVLDALVEIDGLVGQLLSAIAEPDQHGEVALVVVSDHGFGPPLEKELCLSWLLKQSGIPYDFILWGAIGHVFLANPEDLDKAVSLVEPLEGVDMVVRRDQAASLHLATATRTGDLLVVTKPGYQVANMWRSCDAAVVEPEAGYESAGTHGWPAQDNPDMRGILVAAGAGVKHADLGQVLQIDVAPTVCALLGIDSPAQAEGQALDLLVTPR